MPTGYTAHVLEGATFEQFVWNCARAFGALVLMRDEPAGARVPERFEPSSYAADALRRAKARMAELRMSPEQAEGAAAATYDVEIAQSRRWVAEREEQRAKYEAMLARVRAWVPPTQDHTALRSFMIEQLESSIKFDCDTGPVDEPRKKSGIEWLADELHQTLRDVERYEKAHAEELERTARRNEWIAALRKSVPQP